LSNKRINILTPAFEPANSSQGNLTKAAQAQQGIKNYFPGGILIRNLKCWVGHTLLACSLSALIQISANVTNAAADGIASPLQPFTLASHPFWTLDEVRVGAEDHALEDSRRERGSALNLEVLGGRLPGNYGNSILDFFLTPRPNIGALLGFGKTNEFYWGVTWDAKLFGPAFIEASFGGAVHDGPLDSPGLPSYGCRASFRESASLGYELNEHWRLLATVDHMSNGNLCQPNHGLTNAGLRLGYRF
jgi:lipid A 3-O-deacylase